MKDKMISEESKKKLEREYLNSLFTSRAEVQATANFTGESRNYPSATGFERGSQVEKEDDQTQHPLDERVEPSDAIIKEKISELAPLPADFKESLIEKWNRKEGGISMLQNDPKEERVQELKTQELKMRDRKMQGETMHGEIKRVKDDENVSVKQKYGLRTLYAIAAVILVVFATYPFMTHLFRADSINNAKSDVSDSFWAGDAYGKTAGEGNISDESNFGEPDFGEEMRSEGIASIGPTGELSEKKSGDEKKKIIENFTIGINTDQFDLSRDKLEQLAREAGGFISTFDIYTSMHHEKGVKSRNASITVKIPSQNSVGYLDAIHDLGEIYNESKTMDDVTKEYSDIEIEIRNFEEAEKRYLALYQKAESIEDMLRVENELSRLRNLIDTRKAMLINYDYKVMYATFHIHLNEVVEIKPVVSVEPGMWERAKDGFVEGLNAVISGAQNVFVYLVSIIPALIVTIVLLVIALLIVTMIRKKYKKRAARLGDEKVTDRTAKTDVDIRSSSDKQAESE